jgi:hypothetical protein
MKELHDSPEYSKPLNVHEVQQLAGFLKKYGGETLRLDLNVFDGFLHGLCCVARSSLDAWTHAFGFKDLGAGNTQLIISLVRRRLYAIDQNLKQNVISVCIDEEPKRWHAWLNGFAMGVFAYKELGRAIDSDIPRIRSVLLTTLSMLPDVLSENFPQKRIYQDGLKHMRGKFEQFFKDNDDLERLQILSYTALECRDAIRRFEGAQDV